MTAAPVVRGDVRLFFLEGGPGPEVNVSYEGSARVNQPAYGFGDITNIYSPDPNNRRRYVVITKTSGAETPPEFPISNIYNYALSKWLRLGRQKCDHGLQAHMGNCEKPQDYDGGYDKILIIEKARIRQWGLDGNLGSLTPDDEGVSNEEVPFVGEVMYEVKRFDTFGQIGAATMVRPLVAGVIADEVSCGGDCGIPSDGCSEIAWLSSATVGSAGSPPTVYYTDDAGSTVGESLVLTLAANEDAEAIGYDGTYIFVVSSADEGLHYVTKEDLLGGSGVWTKVSGFTTAKGPKAIFVAGPSDIFIAGLGGYVYHSDNVPDAPTILESGSATIEDLNSIHGIDDLHVAAVGNNNAFIYTADGRTWASKTGPAVGVNLTKIWMVSKDIIWVTAADGNLYYTSNGGTTWTAKGFAGSGTGTTNAVVFTTPSVGFLSHTTTGNVGRVFKTINGGKTWRILPEKVGGAAVPAHRTAVEIMPCDQNTFYTAGVNTAGTGGFALKAS